jgi:soluble lytic murein transglycosylase-like protein
MPSRKLQLGSLLFHPGTRKARVPGIPLLLLLTVTAWAQSAPYTVPAASVEAQFSAYHQALSGAADEALQAATAQRHVETKSLAAVPAGRPENSVLRQFAQQYWDGQEENVRRAVERVAQLRPTLDPILREGGIPVDLAALVLVESGGRTTAVSPKGALGLWQLMPETARRYGLVVTPLQDERLDVVKSTRAAARYLRDLYAQFGDWSLAFAAYNTGEEAIQRAIVQSGARDFDSVSRGRRLPLETRNYVPAVLAAVRLLGGTLPTETRPAQRSSNARVIYADIVLND